MKGLSQEVRNTQVQQTDFNKSWADTQHTCTAAVVLQNPLSNHTVTSLNIHFNSIQTPKGGVSKELAATKALVLVPYIYKLEHSGFLQINALNQPLYSHTRHECDGTF